MLREGGLEVGPGRISDALRGLDSVDLKRRDDVYWTLRQTLVSRREDLETFDRAFDAWFLRAAGARPLRELDRPPLRDGERRKGGVPGPGPEVDGGEIEVGAWSEDELLRTRDFASMTPEEFARARGLIQEIALDRPRRRTHRLRRDRRGTRARRARARARVARDRGRPRACARSAPARLAPAEARAAARRLGLDGGVLARAPALPARGARLGPRRRDVRVRDAPDADHLRARRRAIPTRRSPRPPQRVLDWSGGTRIGASLKAFNDEWGRRALTRGAVVVILSDGCERGDTAQTRAEMARLARQAFAVVWVNPLKGHPDYQPLTGGMSAALPYVDRLVTGHDVASLEALGTVLQGIERRHAA